LKEQLIKLLQKLGISQAEFAKALDLKPSTISEIMNGRTKSFNHEVLLKIKNLYNVNLDWLLTGEGEMYLQESKPVDNTDPKIQRIKNLLKEHPEMVDIFDKLLRGSITAKELIHEISSLPEKKQIYLLGQIRELKKL
jgi:transcriptional regulator with XRE-family HTH domain